MTKVVIDLLPTEFKLEQRKALRFYKVQAVGVVAILLVAFLASVLIALRIMQSQNISNIQKALAQSEQQISNLSNTQANLVLLNNRLAAINRYFGIPSKQSEMYKLVNTILPPGVTISSISVDKNGEVLILATVPDSATLDNLITSLTEGAGQEKIDQVTLDNIGRGRDGIYRVNFKIKPSD